MIALLLQATTEAAAAATEAAASTAAAPAGGFNWEVLTWYLVAVAALLFGSVMSGAEIGIFAISKVLLRLRAHQRDKNALILTEWMRKPTYSLEGLLILQNIAGFIFAAAVTNILALAGFRQTGQAVISTLIVTPTILVLADVAPKDLFNAHADKWIYRLVPVLRVAFRVITYIPILPLVRLLSGVSTWITRRIFGRRRTEEIATPRGEIVKLLQESTATGVISSAQQDIVQRALRLARTTIRDVMIPWNRVIGVPQHISREGFKALVRRYPVSRAPVLGRSTTEVLGIVNVLDVLASPPGTQTSGMPGAGRGEEEARVTDFIRPHMTLIGEQDVRSAITLLQRAKQTLAIVIDRQGRAIGIVTLKDLIEELVGDLESW